MNPNRLTQENRYSSVAITNWDTVKSVRFVLVQLFE
jgi:hypothetical protein